MKCDLGDLFEDEMKVLVKITDASEGYLITTRTMKRFYPSLDRPELAAKIRVPPRKHGLLRSYPKKN